MDFGTTTDVSNAGKLVKEVGGIVLDTSSPLQEIRSFDGALVDPEIIESRTKAAYAFVRNYYRLSLETRGPLQKPREFHLDIVDQHRNRVKNVELSYPRYLLPVQSN
jgi:hypothetical protein